MSDILAPLTQEIIHDFSLASQSIVTSQWYEVTLIVFNSMPSEPGGGGASA
jgi:hypothetical protein